MPFNNNEFDEIVCNDVLEHMDNIIAVIEKIWRDILNSKTECDNKDKGSTFSSSNAYGDITHKHFSLHDPLITLQWIDFVIAI